MWNRQRLSESRAAAALVDGTRRLPYLLTSLAAGLAIAVVLAAVVADVQVLEVPLAALDRIEPHETGAIATVILLLIAAFISDHTVAGQRTRRERDLQNQRLRIEQVQIRTVQDILSCQPQPIAARSFRGGGLRFSRVAGAVRCRHSGNGRRAESPWRPRCVRRASHDDRGSSKRQRRGRNRRAPRRNPPNLYLSSQTRALITMSLFRAPRRTSPAHI